MRLKITDVCLVGACLVCILFWIDDVQTPWSALVYISVIRSISLLVDRM